MCGYGRYVLCLYVWMGSLKHESESVGGKCGCKCVFPWECGVCSMCVSLDGLLCFCVCVCGKSGCVGMCVRDWMRGVSYPSI